MFGAARTLLFGGLTGKVLGMVREFVTAALFGTGPIAVAYRLAQAAFLIPLHGFLSDAFGAGFTPEFARSRNGSSERGRALFAGMHAVALVVSVAVGAALALFARPWIGLLAPGLDAATAATAARLVSVLALAMPCYAVANLYAFAEIAAGRGGMTAARASAQNVGLTAGTAIAWWTGSPVWIATGFLVAYAALAGWGARAAHLAGLRFWPRRGEWAPAADALHAVWRAVRLLLLVPALMQVHFVVERRVASLVSADAVAALDYARFLSDTAVLLLAMPLGIAGLGALAGVSETRFRELAHRSLRMLLYAGVPLSLAVAVHGEAIVRLMFGRGAFGAQSVAVTAAILQWLAVGLWGQLVGYAGAKYLNARNRNGRVIAIFALAYGCNIALNLALYRALGAAALGVANAVNGMVFGLAMLVEIGVLARLRRDLTTMGVLAVAYVALWTLAPAGLAANDWVPPLLFSGYWTAAVLLTPRCRRVMYDAWSSFRPA